MTTKELVFARGNLTQSIARWMTAGITDVPAAQKVDEAVALLEAAAVDNYLQGDGETL